jgi:ABC-2 type transport system permease protein
MWMPYACETRYELVRLMRLPAYAVPTLAFPLMFYLLFGVMMAGSRAVGGRDLAPYLLATYGAFGVIGASLFSFGVSVAVERAQGWFLLKRATPMSPAVYVFGKVGASMAFSALIVLCLGVCAAAFGGVRLEAGRWILLAAVLIAGSIPFCAIGLALGFMAGPNSAPAIVNLVYLPAGFASGLLIPIEILPPVFKAAAPWLPQYHLGQLALAAMGLAPAPRPAWHLLALVAWTGVAVTAAAVTFGRDEGKLYG